MQATAFVWLSLAISVALGALVSPDAGFIKTDRTNPDLYAWPLDQLPYDPNNLLNLTCSNPENQPGSPNIICDNMMTVAKTDSTYACAKDGGGVSFRLPVETTIDIFRFQQYCGNPNHNLDNFNLSWSADGQQWTDFVHVTGLASAAGQCDKTVFYLRFPQSARWLRMTGVSEVNFHVYWCTGRMAFESTNTRVSGAALSVETRNAGGGSSSLLTSPPFTTAGLAWSQMPPPNLTCINERVSISCQSMFVVDRKDVGEFVGATDYQSGPLAGSDVRRYSCFEDGGGFDLALQQPTLLSSFKLQNYCVNSNHNVAQVLIDVSSDGISWETVIRATQLSLSGDSCDVMTFDLAQPVLTSFLRLRGWNTASVWSHWCSTRFAAYTPTGIDALLYQASLQQQQAFDSNFVCSTQASSPGSLSRWCQIRRM